MQLKPFLKTLSIIHASLCAGLVIGAGYVYFENGNFTVTTTSDDIFLYLVPTLAIGGYFGSKLLYQKLIQKIKKEEPFAQKIQAYLQASLVQYALLEGPGFFALFAYYYSGNALFLVIALCLILYLYTRRPTRTKLEQELPIHHEERQQFN